MAFLLLFKIFFELRENFRNGGGSGRRRESRGGSDGRKINLIFRSKEGRKVAKRSGVTIKGATRRTVLKMLKVEINFGGSNLLEKWVLRYEIRLSREPGEKTVKVRSVVFNGCLRESFVFGATRFKKETTKVV